VRAVRETKPKAFIFENVKGLTRATFASYLAYIFHQLTYPEIKRRESEDWVQHLARLERHHTARRRIDGLAYNVVYRVLNAADYGIPQRRERVVFVGFRSDLGIKWNFPRETHSQRALILAQNHGNYWDRHRVPRAHRHNYSNLDDIGIDDLFDLRKQPWRTVRDAISDLPDPEREPRKAAEFLNHRFQDGARSYPGHTGSPLDQPAKTLKAGVHGVPGGENMLVRPDGGVRYFTVRESARLQTFPDDFQFHGSWSETMRQLGNAVPVDLAAIIANNVRAHLGAKKAPKRNQ
jgi:DNA (cytosine-5)-methyltransferase 1